MGRYCLVCGRSRPNEQFGGRGQRARVCSKCRKRPKKEWQLILASNEVHGFMGQKNISAKNIKRLREFESIEDAGFQCLRTLVLEIATMHPRKRRRWKNLRQNHPDLYHRIVDSEHFDYLLDQYPIHEHDDEWIEYEESLYRSHPESLENVWFENREP